MRDRETNGKLTNEPKNRYSRFSGASPVYHLRISLKNRFIASENSQRPILRQFSALEKFHQNLPPYTLEEPPPWIPCKFSIDSKNRYNSKNRYRKPPEGDCQNSWNFSLKSSPCPLADTSPSIPCKYFKKNRFSPSENPQKEIFNFHQNLLTYSLV